MTDESIYIGQSSDGDGDAKAEPPATAPPIPNASDEPRAPRDFRRESLLFLLEDLRRQGPEQHALAEQLVGLHPEAAALRLAAPPQGSFADLVFDELAVLEAEQLGVEIDSNLQNREPLAYWLRRRDLDRHSRVVDVCRRLPAVFAVIVRTGDKVIQRGCMELSARMIAGALLAMPDLDRRAKLRPLHSATARRVFELIADSTQPAIATSVVPPHDVTAATAWLAGWDKIASDPARGPRRVGDLLGRMLLSTLFRRLDPVLRLSALEVSITVVCQKLEEGESLELDPASPAWSLADELAEGVFLGL